MSLKRMSLHDLEELKTSLEQQLFEVMSEIRAKKDSADSATPVPAPAPAPAPKRRKAPAEASSATETTKRDVIPTIKVIKEVLDANEISYRSTMNKDELWELIKTNNLVRHTKSVYSHQKLAEA